MSHLPGIVPLAWDKAVWSYSSQIDITVDPTVVASFNLTHSRITGKGVSVMGCLDQMPLGM